ncbi:MAG: UDP-galactopyranose mutase [Promethearchaeota archaeon]|jgi:UDP-galactopyranose mutase
MSVLILGAGLTGCAFARLLKDNQIKVLIREKKNHIGGLCLTRTSPNGILYEPYGGHAFHTRDRRVIKFVSRFSEFNNYKHNKGIIINGILHHFPLSRETILKMEENAKILKELEEAPKIPDLTNFETYAKSKFGNTLYQLFIYNYSKKMWDVEPIELSNEYLLNRINLTEKNNLIFGDDFQGLPLKGYSQFLKNMIYDIPLELNNCNIDETLFDLILFSGRIDELHNFKYGKLQFRSLRFDYKDNAHWENETYGSINLPQHPRYIRKVNFKIMHQQKTNNSWIQYQEPIPLSINNLPMYPIYTKQNIELFDKYLKEACKSGNIIPVGRLGLYKYLEMGQAISLAMDMIPLIEEWKNLEPKARYLEIKKLLYG